MFKKLFFLFLIVSIALSACGTLEVSLDQTPTPAVDAGQVATIVAATLAAIPSSTPIPTGTPSQVADAAHVRYAKPAASGSGDCSSWANACALQTALSGAVSGNEVWVAAGTHKPTTGTDRNATFQLKAGVAIYGGFSGTETARDQRNFTTNAALLSGDLNGDDAGYKNNAENVYHVVIGATGATLDGFTITAGNANGAFPNNCGGGMYNQFSNPTLANVIFSQNSAIDCGGGGMYNESSNPILTNITFSDNSASGGGGMRNDSSNPTLTNVTFSKNSAMAGGGMLNVKSSPVLTNIIFSGNRATAYGGGMSNTSNSNPTLTNVTFSGNQSLKTAESNGGGMSNDSSSPMLTNVTFNGNSAMVAGGGMHNRRGSNPQIRNAIFWDNTAPTGAQIFNDSSAPNVSDSVVQDGCPAESTCANIITGDPMLGALGNYGGFTQTIPLLTNSSAIDTGTNTNRPATDQRGVTRPQGIACDIGAFEFKDFKVDVGPLSISCPKPDFFTVTAEITSNGPGAVAYGWMPGGWQPPPKETLNFDRASTQTVTRDFPFSINNSDTKDLGLDWILLQIFQPEALLTDKIPRKCP